MRALLLRCGILPTALLDHTCPPKAPTHLDNEEHVVGFSGIQAIDDISASLASPNGKRATFRYGVGEDFIV